MHAHIDTIKLAFGCVRFAGWLLLAITCVRAWRKLRSYGEDAVLLFYASGLACMAFQSLIATLVNANVESRTWRAYDFAQWLSNFSLALLGIGLTVGLIRLVSGVTGERWRPWLQF